MWLTSIRLVSPVTLMDHEDIRKDVKCHTMEVHLMRARGFVRSIPDESLIAPIRGNSELKYRLTPRSAYQAVESFWKNKVGFIVALVRRHFIYLACRILFAVVGLSVA